MAATVLHNQSLLDIALQATGKAENAILIAVANNISITESLESGAEVIISENSGDVDIKNYYNSKNIQPASATNSQIINYPGGIDFWSIENDFVVS